MSAFTRDTTGAVVVQAFSQEAAGKTIVITGASVNGLGAQTALDLAAAGPAQMFLLARSASKVQPVIDEIAKISPTTRVTFVSVSLDDISTVRTAADEVGKSLSDGKVDILINNAGIMAVPYSKTKLGIESQFATNHIGHFVLTQRLYPYIKAAGSSGRIVNLTSDGYHIDVFHADDVNFDDGKTYDEFSGYGQSKTANILFTKGLAKRGVTSLAVHPGVIMTTSIGNHLPDMSVFGGIPELSKRNTGWDFKMNEPKTIQQGVATTIRAALDPDLKEQSGAYMEDCQVVDTQEHAKDVEMVQKLWSLSEDLVKEKFVI